MTAELALPQAAAPAAAAPALLLSLHGAGVRFGNVVALQGIDLALRRGERLALVGANGSGKTTLLRLLHGLQGASGERRAHERPDGTRAVVAMLFQRPFLLSVSVRLNVRLALWLRGVPRAERDARTMVALRRVGLEAQAARPARALSGGQQQRLALARAWALKPDVLLLDEPTASLDPSAKREVETLIDELAGEGTSLVMATHNLGQAKRLAERVIYLEAGCIAADLPVERFFDRGADHAAALFLKGELPWT
ncbi:MAG: phosphate ABC transporter ATP-binding protein [Burkholderiaceae bacterium]